ncbi:AP2-like ethylene-responsive transcription factor ANT isoform X2 [Miscanthus floridulus]|uniref:AP2-like ethylene-responsive transcription factor ANT isoform X2 n=1 Tax=Miscanthus floridulus TaxID=154761 RepID=UPI003459BA12
MTEMGLFAVYLGRYDTEHMAARAYDLAALKYRGLATYINFSVENYRDELEKMKSMTKQEFVQHLRMHHGRWSSQIGCSGSSRNSLVIGIFI